MDSIAVAASRRLSRSGRRAAPAAVDASRRRSSSGRRPALVAVAVLTRLRNSRRWRLTNRLIDARHAGSSADVALGRAREGLGSVNRDRVERPDDTTRP